MKQVLLNWLMNALRYTPEHGIIHFRLLKEDNHYLKLMIEDTGIGIESMGGRFFCFTLKQKKRPHASHD
jgi:signal transduction histidine kinase